MIIADVIVKIASAEIQLRDTFSANGHGAKGQPACSGGKKAHNGLPIGACGLQVKFRFLDPAWKKLSKTAVFRNKQMTMDAIIQDDCAVIPHELLTMAMDTVDVGVYGTNSDRSLAIPTVWTKLGVVSSAANPSESISAEPTIPYWAQIKEQVDTMQSEMLSKDNLDDALMKAKESGLFDGPQGEQGEKGEQGEQGRTGPAGAAGKDGYSPVAGLDYWTAAEKNAIISQAANLAADMVAKSSDIFCQANGSAISLTNSAEREFRGLKIYGKTTQAGKPTPDAPVALVNISNGGNFTVTVSASQMEEAAQSLTVFLQKRLSGLATASGGNYTDQNGQQWICDEVDIAAGKCTQRVYQFVLDGTVSPILNGGSAVDANGGKRFAVKLPYLPATTDSASIAVAMCTHAGKLTSQGDNYHYSGNEAVFSIGDSEGYVGLRIRGINTVDGMKAYLAQNPVTIQYVLATPMESDLTAGEVDAYHGLHTSYPNTMIRNSAGADMGVAYVADTKLYIDGKFAELASAIANPGE